MAFLVTLTGQFIFMPNQAPAKIQLKDYRPYPYSILQTNLSFELDKKRTIVKSKLEFALNKNDEVPEYVSLDGENLELIELKLNGRLLDTTEYTYSNDTLHFPPPSDKFSFEAMVAISPEANKALSGLYLSGESLCTQCEAEGFRRITFFPDRPDVMSRFFVRLEANKDTYPILLANGNPIASGTIGENHFAEWNDPWPKPSYLFAIVAGNLLNKSADFKTLSGKNVKLNIYVESVDIDRIDYAMDALIRSMKWDEDVFGREYDLDVFNVVGVRDFNAGAMENKGLNIFNSALLVADSQTATDFDFANIERVIAHEYFHNWSGNRVTCRDWFQLSLKEGLTVFRDQEFSADQRSRAVQRIHDVIQLRARQFAEDAGPNAHSVRPHEYASIDNFYTSTIYEKGAEVIRVAQNILGESNFNKGAIKYFETNDGKAATIEDWLEALRSSSNDPLDGIEKWYSQAGTPILDVKTDLVENTYSIKLVQNTPPTNNQPVKEWVPIPLDMAFFNKNGEKMVLDFEGTHIDSIHLNLSTEETLIEFEGIDEKPVLSILRGFTAPVKLISDHTNEELAILAAHDDDTFVRWESLQTIARKELLIGADAVKNNMEFATSKILMNCYNNVFDIAQNDYAYAALLLQLPATNDLIQASSDAYPENIFAARELLATTIYEQNKDKISKFIADYKFDAAYSPDAKSAGLRSYAAACFYLLSFDDSSSELLEYFKSANNMTDKMSLLFALARKGDDAWSQALNIFYNDWKSNNLVLDKYFSNQAASASGNSVKRLKDLLAHPDFVLTNPNRVRSVLASFAVNNPVGFNSADGSGYETIVNELIKLDNINPMVAARVATAFERVVKIEPQRRSIAKQHLERLLRENISKQMQEIVSSINKSI